MTTTKEAKQISDAINSIPNLSSNSAHKYDDACKVVETVFGLGNDSSYLYTLSGTGNIVVRAQQVQMQVNKGAKLRIVIAVCTFDYKESSAYEKYARELMNNYSISSVLYCWKNNSGVYTPHLGFGIKNSKIVSKLNKVYPDLEIELIEPLINNNSIKRNNIIYYGPPGTGKTRKIQMNHLAGKDDRNSKFITFHQSYSYEEFIEGLKPQVIHGHESVYENTNLREFIKYSFDALIGDLSWEVMSQNIQETDSTINANQYRGLRFPDFFGANNLLGKFETPQTTTSLSSAGTQRYFETPITNNAGENVYLTTQWGDVDGEGLTYKNFQRFILKISGGLYSSIQKDGKFVLTQRSESNSNVIYKIMKGVFYDACESASRLAGYSSLQECISDTVEGRSQKLSQAITSNNIVVMCNAEINRANISSVFGDLITLIESKKRLGEAEEMSAILPYSKEKFGVPSNLQIIGTMNTADRSITLLDSALRRRFHFEELLPRPEVLQGIEIDGIKVSLLLEKLNKRITYFLGKDQSIGHSYFIGLDKSITPKKDLLSIFRNNIIPLLEEYFYNDIPKIRLVLGENNKSEELSFYRLDEESDIEKLFGNIDEDIDQDEESSSYVKNDVLFELSISGEEDKINKDVFIKIYE